MTSPLSSLGNSNFNNNLISNYQTADSDRYTKRINEVKNYEKVEMGGDILNYTKNILDRRGVSPRENTYQNKYEDENYNHKNEEYKSVSFKNEVTYRDENSNSISKEKNYPPYNTNNTINSLHVFSSMHSNPAASMTGNESAYSDKQFIIEELRNEIINLESHKENFERECYTLKNKNNELLQELIEIKKTKKVPKESYEYKIKFSNLAREYECLSSQYEKSERIREEQNNLIRSLQREIDILRETYIKEKLGGKSIEAKRSGDKNTQRSLERDKSVENPFNKNLEKTENPKKKKKSSKSSEKVTKRSKSKSSNLKPEIEKKVYKKVISQNNLKPIPVPISVDKKKKTSSMKSRDASPLVLPLRKK